ncbi:MAG: hypothetical protein HKM04_01115 [Legionellales bacterium]|nr:hypothetical protein [Legionellales bacterium]
MTEPNQPHKIHNKLDTYGDGNCGLNAFALKLFELAKLNQLRRVFDDENFKAFRKHLLDTLPTLRDKGSLPESFIHLLNSLTEHSELTTDEFEKCLQNVDPDKERRHIQEALAPALRRYMLDDYVPYSLQPLNFQNFKGIVSDFLNKNSGFEKDHPSLQGFCKVLATDDEKQVHKYMLALKGSELDSFTFAITVMDAVIEKEKECEKKAAEKNPKKKSENAPIAHYSLKENLLRGLTLRKEYSHVDDNQLDILANKVKMNLFIKEASLPDEFSRWVTEKSTNTVTLAIVHSSSDANLNKTNTPKNGHWSLGVFESDEPAKELWDNIPGAYADIATTSPESKLREENIVEASALMKKQCDRLLEKLGEPINSLMNDILDRFDTSQYKAALDKLAVPNDDSAIYSENSRYTSASEYVIGHALLKLEDIYQTVLTELNKFVDNLLLNAPDVLLALPIDEINAQIVHFHNRSLEQHGLCEKSSAKTADKIIGDLCTRLPKKSLPASAPAHRKPESAAHSLFNMYPEQKIGEKRKRVRQEDTEEYDTNNKTAATLS